MGLKDSYSYHSMSGGWSGDEKPGREKKEAAGEEDECEECGEISKRVVERQGNLKGLELCPECTDDLELQAMRESRDEVIQKVRGDD